MVVGFDRHINYFKIQTAQLCISENPGCLFIATNLDAKTHLTDAQEWAGNGAMVGAIKGVPRPAPLLPVGEHRPPFLQADCPCPLLQVPGHGVLSGVCTTPPLGWSAGKSKILLVGCHRLRYRNHKYSVASLCQASLCQARNSQATQTLSEGCAKRMYSNHGNPVAGLCRLLTGIFRASYCHQGSTGQRRIGKALQNLPGGQTT